MVPISYATKEQQTSKLSKEIGKVSTFKDPVSGFTHLIGAVAAVPITIFLGLQAYEKASKLHVITFIIFGVSLFLLYLASTVYHLSTATGKKESVLRAVDHMMVFVLIAGSYTPLCVVTLGGRLGYSLLVLVWGVAIIGILIKMFFMNAPRWLSTGLYIGMGWLALLAIVPLFKKMPLGGFVLLVSGGVLYTVGGLIYACKWPKITSKYFGFHELFHLFVLGGSTLHVIMMFRYVMIT